MGNPPAGMLRLGAIETAASTFLTPLLAEYTSCYPEVKHSLVTGGTHELNQKVIQHELHGALIYGPIDHPELNYMKMYDEELVLIAEPGVHEMSRYCPGRCCFLRSDSRRDQAESFLKDQGIHTLNIMEYEHWTRF